MESNQKAHIQWTRLRTLTMGCVKDRHLVMEKHSLIAENASELFMKKGFHATTTDTIAEACKISKGQLYNYISTKDDILILIHNHLNDLWDERIAESGFEKESDPYKKLRLVIRVSAKFNIEHKPLIRMIFRDAKYIKDEYRRELHEIHYKQFANMIHEILIQLDRDHPIARGTNTAAKALTAFLYSFAFSWPTPKSKKQLSEYLEYSIDFLLRGLGVG
jgi:AcrR family transcriptional regulator